MCTHRSGTLYTAGAFAPRAKKEKKKGAQMADVAGLCVRLRHSPEQRLTIRYVIEAGAGKAYIEARDSLPAISQLGAFLLIYWLRHLFIFLSFLTAIHEKKIRNNNNFVYATSLFWYSD